MDMSQDKESGNFLIYIRLGNAVLAFGPPKQIIIYEKRDVAMHAHGLFEFHSLYDGEAQIETEQGYYVFRSGNIALIPPNIYHSVKNTTDSFDLRSFYFSLSLTEDKQDAAQLYTNEIREFIRHKNVIIMDGPSTIMWIVDHLCDEISNNSLLGTAYLQEAYSVALLMMLLRKFISDQQFSTMCMNEPTSVSSFIDPFRAIKIEMYFANNYQNGSIQGLARTLGFSEQHVRRILLVNYGMPFSQILNKYRINISKKLLRDTELPITRIWESVGFNTPQSFNKVFRMHMNCTPTQYRNQKRHGDIHNQ